MIAQDKLNSNPWRLTPAQIRVIEALVRLGSQKVVAYELGVSLKTVEAHMATARTRMKVHNQIQVVVLFIEWKRTAQPAAEPTP